MIKWGFSLADINQMPLNEYYEYLKLINAHHKDEADMANAASRGTSQQNSREEPKPIGMVAPRKP